MSNIYTRVLSGEFQVVNQHLLRDLTELGVWTDDLKNDIVSANGSIQYIGSIPDKIKKLYKTVWEISQKNVIQQAADRGAFIDQSQSLNIHIQLDALLRLGEWPEDQHVLPEDQARRPGHPVHRGQVQGQGFLVSQEGKGKNKSLH